MGVSTASLIGLNDTTDEDGGGTSRFERLHHLLVSHHFTPTLLK